PTDEVTLSVRVITRTGSRRVARAAYELARQRRRHLTYVHKDTVFKLGCGMFVEECRKLAPEYPDVEVDDVIVDTFAMRLVRDPPARTGDIRGRGTTATFTAAIVVNLAH